MKKKILCFSSEQMLQGSFFMQIKKAVQFQYTIEKKQIFDEIECYFIPDLICRKQTFFLNRIILVWKKKWFIRKFVKGNHSFPVIISAYDMKDKSDFPPDVRYLCAAKFIQGILFQKNTVLGIVDGDALDYKLWVKLLRERLDCINGLMIVSDRPESFTELRRDAWEQHGLIVTITENETELQFCDIVMDCSFGMPAKKYAFRRPCHYFMLSEYKKKRKQLMKQNQWLRFTDCGDYAQKI